jgi:hypothetical protein
MVSVQQRSAELGSNPESGGNRQDLRVSLCLSLLKTPSPLNTLRFHPIRTTIALMIPMLLRALISILATQRQLTLENLALRQQIAVLQRSVKRPLLKKRPSDRRWRESPAPGSSRLPRLLSQLSDTSVAGQGLPGTEEGGGAGPRKDRRVLDGWRASSPLLTDRGLVSPPFGMPS